MTGHCPAYGRDGHLFKERFRSEPCEDWTYFVTLLRYIHQNPVKAGMVNRVSEYEFTSWHEYLGGADFFPLCNVNAVLGRISMDELTALVDVPLTRCPSDPPSFGHLLTEKNIIEKLQAYK